LNGVEQELAETRRFTVHEVRLEQALRCLESLATDTDDTAVGEGVVFNQDSGILAQVLVELEIV
jgi:hypothetical protein